MNWQGRSNPAKPFFRRAKNKTQPFEIERKAEGIIHVWLGEPRHSESDFVMSINETLIPALIAKLKAHTGKR
jgi:hypothetical protein